jgi:hypothetical protein
MLSYFLNPQITQICADYILLIVDGIMGFFYHEGSGGWRVESGKRFAEVAMQHPFGSGWTE